MVTLFKPFRFEITSNVSSQSQNDRSDKVKGK